VVTIAYGNGDGTFPTNPVAYIAGSAPQWLATGDANGDGKPDMATPVYVQNACLPRAQRLTHTSTP
jgi:FG-GAP-like repeat